MEVSALDTSSSTLMTNSTAKVNAYNIGTANKPEVELSAQARVLSQNFDRFNNTQISAEASSPQTTKDTPQKNSDSQATETIQVSSTIGKTARSSNLTTEQAVQIYRAIESLI